MENSTQLTEQDGKNPLSDQLAKHQAVIDETPDKLLALAEQVEDPELRNKLEDLASQTTADIPGLDPSEARLKIPFISIVAPMTGEEKLPEGAKVGHMFTSNGELLGEKFDFIPLFIHRTRKKWASDGSKKVECYSADSKLGNKYGECAKCNFRLFEKGVTKAECNSGWTCQVISADLTNLYTIEFTKSNAKAGEDIFNKARRPGLYARTHTLTVEKKEHAQSKGKYYNYIVKQGGLVDEQTFKLCEMLAGFAVAGRDRRALMNYDNYNRRQLGLPPEHMDAPQNALDADKPNTDAIDFSQDV